MSHVEFPGLGWSFDINSTAFSIGSFEIKWYGLLIATGFLLAVIYAMVMCKNNLYCRHKRFASQIKKIVFFGFVNFFFC